MLPWHMRTPIAKWSAFLPLAPWRSRVEPGMPLIVAHRGASHDAPENTLAAIERGWERGAELVEIDVRLSADGVLFAIHDADTLRTTGVRGEVARLSARELDGLEAGSWKGARWQGEKLPRLAAVLARIPPHQGLLIEVKHGVEGIPALLADLDACDARERVIVQGFGYEALAELKARAPELFVFLLIEYRQEAAGWAPSRDTVLALLGEGAFDGVGPGDSGPLDAESCAAFHAAGKPVFVWTVNDPERARALVAMGVDALITDRPGWLRERLRA